MFSIRICRYSTHFCRIRDGGIAPPPPHTHTHTNNFRKTKMTPDQQIIYHWERNLMARRIHFKYWKNILISRLYEQCSKNDSAMAPEKIKTLKI